MRGRNNPMRHGRRDWQRSKVYKAESDRRLAVDRAKHVMTPAEIRAEVNRLVATSEFRKAWPHVSHILVKDGRARRSAYGCAAEETGGMGEIGLPKFARYRLMVCHEVAHVVTAEDVPGHGAEFCANYLLLVGMMISGRCMHLLAETFDEVGVKYLSSSEAEGR